MIVATAHGFSGPVFEFLVVFTVILLGPIVLTRLKLPGLIGLVLGGFVIGAHGLNLVHAGDQTVPELGQLGLLYLMFVAGLELDLQVLRAYRRATIVLGLLAFAIPALAGVAVGLALGWSVPATCLLAALVASHTLIVYPQLRDAGLGDHPAVATAVGATVLTDTLALIVLAVVAGSQTDSGSPAYVLVEIAIGFVLLGAATLVGLPRLADLAMRRWGADPVARYLVALVALLAMALLAQLFGIEGIVGAFFAGLALNRLVPNDGPSMERVEFFGAAVFVPIFLVSIGLLLDPSVMFTGSALGLAALICLAALGGKAVACALAGHFLGFTWPERVAMYVLTAPQAAATLAVTLIGFEIGVFGTTVVNAVLVLILVSILASAVITERVTGWIAPRRDETPRLGARVLLVAGPEGPTDAAVQSATLLARPDGGLSDLLLVGDDHLGATARRLLDRRMVRLGFEGHVRTDVGSPSEAVQRALRLHEYSAVVVDDASLANEGGAVPVVVVGAKDVVVTGGRGELEAEIDRRLARR